MKSTGIVRKVDELGRVVLPAEIRKNLNISLRDPIEIYTKDDLIYLRKYQFSCVICGELNHLKLFNEKHICKDCVKELIDEGEFNDINSDEI
ncbi:SpoVT/AbrB family regulatory protein [Clostridia bacterium]|nr:SpoVT/AbrB family regulatory protein [Clostridia bacterium]